MRTKESTWFAHDCNDEKEPAMIAMCMKYKMEGYGRWWRLMEILRMEDDYRYAIDTPFAYKVLANRMMTTEARVKEFIAELINEYKLLQTDGRYIWSDGFVKRMQFMEDKKKKLREAGRKGGHAKQQKRLGTESDNGATATPVQNGSDAIAELQHFVAHNTTLHNTTLHNKTEQNKTRQNNPPKPPKGIEPTDRQEDENANTSLNTLQNEPKQNVLPRRGGHPLQATPPVNGRHPHPVETKFPLQGAEGV